MDKAILLAALAGVVFLGFTAFQKAKTQGAPSTSTDTGSTGGDPAFSIGNALNGIGLKTDPRTVQCQKFPSLCIGDPRFL